MHAEKSQAKADKRRLRMGEHARRRLAPGARMHDDGETAHHDGKYGKYAGGKRADPMARGRHRSDHHRGRRCPQRKIVAGALDAFAQRPGSAVARRQRDGDGEDDGIKHERARRRPVEEPQDGRDGEPDEGCRRDAEHDPMPLRECGVAQRKDRNGRVRGHAADGASGDECGRVFQRQDDVGRAGSGRQRSDERGHQGPAPLGRNRHGDDHRRGHHRLEGQSIPKERIGGHPTSESDTPAKEDQARSSFTSMGGPLLSVW
jgi:hypothetical protein